MENILAWPLAGIKNSPKTCEAISFLLFSLNLKKEIAVGDGSYQSICSEQKGHQLFIGGNT